MHTVDDLKSNLAAVVEAARDVYGPDVTRITVDPMPSGELPFQITLATEDVPLAGLATLPADALP